MLSRRRFLESAFVAAIAASLGAAEGKRAPRVVLRSSWQTVNIVDIAHTPGMLALLEKYFPEAEVTLWPSNVENGVKEMLAARFPKLKFVGPKPDVAKLYAENDFLLHGSGPSLVGEKQVAMWRKQGPKPYGVLGITQGKPTPETVEILSGAQFVYFRDSVSLETAKAGGVKCPVMEFGPDGAFATDLRNEETAEAFLHGWGLERGKFLCCIPRYRSTPYWLIKPGTTFDPVKQKRNDEMKEHDHAQLRAAIIAVVKQTDLKVLICPEDRTQMALGKEILFDKLPDDVKSEVQADVDALKSALAGEDEDALKKAMEALATSQTKLGEALYQAEPDAGAPEDGETSESAEDEDIVDAEVVDDDTDTKK